MELNHVPKVSYYLDRALSKAIKQALAERVEHLLSIGGNPDAIFPGRKKFRPLIQACYIQDDKAFVRNKIIDILLRYNANPSLQDDNGQTAMHHASKLQQLPILSRLVRCDDSDLTIKDKKGFTVLHICAQVGKEDMLRIVAEKMCRYKYDISTRNRDGETPLSLAIRHGNWNCAKYLHDKGAFPRLTENEADEVWKGCFDISKMDNYLKRTESHLISSKGYICHHCSHAVPIQRVTYIKCVSASGKAKTPPTSSDIIKTLLQRPRTGRYTSSSQEPITPEWVEAVHSYSPFYVKPTPDPPPVFARDALRRGTLFGDCGITKDVELLQRKMRKIKLKEKLS